MSGPSPVLSDELKAKIRHHMGYTNVQAVQTFVLGTPAGIETSFIIEGAMNRLLPEALPQVTRHIEILDNLEAQILEDQELLAVTKVDEIDIRQDEFIQLAKQYHYWRSGLGNIFGVPPNPFDQRFMSWGGASLGGMNMSVRH